MKKLPRVTTRWLYSVFGVIVFILLCFVISISAVVFTYYDSSVKNKLAGQAEGLSDYYTQHISPQYPDLLSGMPALAADFSEKDIMELQLIEKDGSCIYTTVGYAVGSEKIVSEDFVNAVTNKETSSFKGENPNTNEQIMAVSAPLYAASGEILGVVRTVTSMEAVTNRAWAIVFAVSAICLGIILFVFVTNYYFIGTIISPLKTITETANQIAAGNMAVRIENKYDDEVGQLVGSINNMANDLEENERLQNEFISSISHELRTPMTAIKGWSETVLICDPAEDAKTIRKGLNIVNKEVDRLSGMVEELLDFSRIQGGRMNLYTENMDLGEKIYSIVTIISERALSRKINVEFELPEELIPVSADPDRMNQVFINIIDNAIKHSEDGSTVTITLRALKQNAVVTISDNGEGIREEDLPHIKEKFYKGVNSKQGTGLGLAIANEIVNLHGGSLNIESKVNEGTTVTITLPLLNA